MLTFAHESVTYLNLFMQTKPLAWRFLDVPLGHEREEVFQCRIRVLHFETSSSLRLLLPLAPLGPHCGLDSWSFTFLGNGVGIPLNIEYFPSILLADGWVYCTTAACHLCWGTWLCPEEPFQTHLCDDIQKLLYLLKSIYPLREKWKQLISSFQSLFLSICFNSGYDTIISPNAWQEGIMQRRLCYKPHSFGPKKSCKQSHFYIADHSQGFNFLHSE